MDNVVVRRQPMTPEAQARYDQLEEYEKEIYDHMGEYEGDETDKDGKTVPINYEDLLNGTDEDEGK